MGDFNANIGSDNQGYENVMGVHGLGVMNDNGEWFVKAKMWTISSDTHQLDYIPMHHFIV